VPGTAGLPSGLELGFEETYEVVMPCKHVADVPSIHRPAYGLGAGWLCRSCDGLRMMVEAEGEDHISAAVEAYFDAYADIVPLHLADGDALRPLDDEPDPALN
jgi:hypothetical protein